MDSTQVTYRNNLAHHFEIICKNIPLVMIEIACTVIVNIVIRSTLFCAVFNWQEWNETLTEISTFNFWLKYLIHRSHGMQHTVQGIPYAADILLKWVIYDISWYTSSIDQMIWPTNFKDEHLLVFWFISVKFKTHGSRKLILSFSWNNFQISRFDWWIKLYQTAIAK